MARKQNSEQWDKPPYFARWEIIISFIALIVSIASLWITMRSEKMSSAPNVQIRSVEASLDHAVQNNGEDSSGEKIYISCTAILENVGNAPTQIVNIRWEPITVGEQMKVSQQWLAISDKDDPMDERNYNYFYDLRNNPVLALKKPTILGGEKRDFKIAFRGQSILNKGQDTPNIRLIFVFNNGQELTVLPEIKYSGVSI
jgi:hypothetical protein